MFKVCHLTSVHKITDGRIFQKECVSLAKHGFDVTIIACGEDSFRDINQRVNRISLHVPVKGRLERAIKRNRAVYNEAIKVDADIYQFHDPELLPIGLKLKRRGKKVIFDSHEFYGLQIKGKKYIPSFLRGLLAKIYMKYEAYVCKRLDAVIQVCTIQGKNYFENRAKRTIFIANTPFYKKRVEINPFKDRNQITHIGSLTYERGITHLIKAAYLADTKLIIAGNFHSDIYYKELQDLNDFVNVDYRGYVDSKEIETILNQCFAGVSTLLHVGQYDKIDTLPTKVYEYMKAGIPVIISDTSFAKEINEKYKVGVCVDPENIDQIKRAIVYFKLNKNLAEQMGNNGRNAFEKLFNWEIEEKKLLDLYNSM